uniref:Lipocalin n=1 Tax=Rhipicephalus zambeziensis TaxID=60191 RepID=A0A224YNC5_9ACAR
MRTKPTERSWTYFVVVLLALIPWASAVTSVAIRNPFDHLMLDLSRYQDPWLVINSTRDVYLARATGIPKNVSCVLSHYWGYEAEKETVHRSLDFNFTGESSNVSLNMSINVKYYRMKTPINLTTLDVSFTMMLPAVLPGMIDGQPYNIANYSFLVLYADKHCLLLASILEEPGAPICSLWFPENGKRRPPACCQFLFYILCGKDTNVYQPSCSRKESKLTNGNMEGQYL